ncbi:MAG: hypothetical protein ACRDXX_07135 [Stackebrandtia sp.]
MRAQLIWRLPFVSAAVCFAYATVHAWWVVYGAPSFMDGGESVFLPELWPPAASAALASAASLFTGVGERRGWPKWTRWTSVGVGAVAGAAMIAYCFLFWIGLAMLVVAPFGASMNDPELFAVRAWGVLGGTLTLYTARAELRRLGPGCDRCGRRHGRSPERRADPAPWWAYAGAYLALAGATVRFGRLLDRDATAASLFDGPGGAAFAVFVGLMLLAGTVLPLALAHRWGRIWPRWTWPLAGRPVPRWLVLGPGLGMGVGLGLYFGVFGMIAIAAGHAGGGELEIAGYTVWGVGLLLASASYHRLTKPECPEANGPRSTQSPTTSAAAQYGGGGS